MPRRTSPGATRWRCAGARGSSDQRRSSTCAAARRACCPRGRCWQTHKMSSGRTAWEKTTLTGQKAWGAPGGRQGTQRRRSMPDHCIGETTHTRECTGRKEEKTRGTNTTERYLRPLRPAGRAASLLPFRFLLKTVTDEDNGAVEEEESQIEGKARTGTRGQSGQQWSLGESRSRHPSTGCFKQR